MGKLTLEALEILDAIARRGSFTGAGEELHKVPSTISYTVSKIESDLDVSLFRRNGPRIDITEAGQELLREGRVLLQAAAELEFKVKRVASGWESRLQLAVDSIISVDALAPMIARFHEASGTTALRIAEETLTGTWESLLDTRSDIVIAAGPGPAGGGYLAREVATLDFWFCVAPFHPLAKANEPLTQAQIRKHRAVVVADSARHLPPRTIGLLSGQDTLAVPNMRTKFHFHKEGLGVGYLPVLCAQGAVEAGSLVRKRVEAEKLPETLSVAWRAGAQGNALDWWIERLADAGAMKGLLESSRRAFAASGRSAAQAALAVGTKRRRSKG
jgi:DNA-binding transcriptional LysR family regulator